MGWQLEFRGISRSCPSASRHSSGPCKAHLQSAICDCASHAGNTAADRNGEVHGGFVLGRAVVVVEANDYDPEPIDLQMIATTLAELPELDKSFWREALAFADMDPPDEPRAYLLSWGPLCYAAVYAGIAVTRDVGTPVYKIIANQDMHKAWSESGVDGVHLESVEFSSVNKLELAEARLEVAAKHDKPRFWLICRYD